MPDDPPGTGSFTEDGCWVRLLAAPDPLGQAALFLDRDGVLIEERHYLADPAGVSLIAGADAAIRSARAHRMRAIFLTNQSGIGRGFFGWAAYHSVEARFLELLSQKDALPDAIFACPFHPAGKPPYARNYPWRKPAPGMLLDAGARFGLRLEQSMMAGDKLSDVQAAMGAGLAMAVHVATGHGAADLKRVMAFASANRRFAVACVASIAALPGLLDNGWASH